MYIVHVHTKRLDVGRAGENSLDRLAADLRHDGALAAEVLVAQAQEVIDHKRCNTATHIT